MSFIEKIMSALGFDERRREYSLDELAQHHARFVAHVDRARELIESRLTRESVARLAESIGRTRYTYMWNYKSWMEDEFIPRIAYAVGRGVPSSEYNAGNLSIGEHISEAKRSSACVSDALSFLLCDERSPVDMRKAFGHVGDLQDRVRWVSDGKMVVRSDSEKMIRSLEAASSELNAKGG